MVRGFLRFSSGSFTGRPSRCDSKTAAEDRLIPRMLDDPSVELRRDAVARVLGDAGFTQTVRPLTNFNFVGFENTKDVTVSITLPDGQVESFIMGFVGFATSEPDPAPRIMFKVVNVGQVPAVIADAGFTLCPVGEARFTSDPQFPQRVEPGVYKMIVIEGPDILARSKRAWVEDGTGRKWSAPRRHVRRAAKGKGIRLALDHVSQS